MTSYDELLKLKEQLEDQWLLIPGVNGIALGRKIVNNQRTDEMAITVYVTSKKSISEIDEAHRIPPVIGNFKTDVVEQAPVRISKGPYSGGFEIKSEYDTTSVGSVGCFGFTKEPSPRPVMVTNQHVVLPFKVVKFKGGEVGTKICSCCSSCCSTILGVLHNAVLSDNVDGAVALLRSGIKILHEIPGIGIIKGTRPLTAQDEANNTKVKMYSTFQKKVVTGTVQTITFTGPSWYDEEHTIKHRDSKNQIGILGDPQTPGFGEGGDSGNVVLDSNNMVVGLLYGGVVNGGYACPIEAVETELGITIGKTNATGQVFTVPSSPGIPSAAQPLLNYPLTAGETMEAYEQKMQELYDQVMAYPVFQFYHRLFLRHRTEIRTMVNTNKKVATTWHRNKGPAFLNVFYKNLLDEDFVFVKEIESVRLEDLLRNMAEILKKYGTAELINDINTYLDEILIYERAFATRKQLLSKLANSLPQCPAA